MQDVTFLHPSYDPYLVALSVLIAWVSSYAALDLGGRVTAACGWARIVWLAGGSLAMGFGIWAMHYIGMLAYSLPVTVLYNIPMVLVSLLAAVLASFVALFVASRPSLGKPGSGIGALLMGAGISSMHYIGMEAMRLPAMCHYSPALVTLSVALAVAISLVALWLTFQLRTEGAALGWRKIGASLLMGGAIPVMHYTGMAAVRFAPMDTAVDLSNSLEITALGIIGIGSATLIVLAIAIVTSLVDRRFSAQAKELEVSEQRYRQLVESARVIMWRADLHSRVLNFVNNEAEELLGYPASDWINTPAFWKDRIHVEDLELANRGIAAAVEDRESVPFEHRMLRADGDVVWLRTSIRRVQGCDELVGVMTDITERRRAQQAVEESSAAKDKLLAEIDRLNHRLKTENNRMSAELDVTRRIQTMMLPHDDELTGIAGLDIAASMKSATEVGGDYYDVLVKDGRVLLGIGDVTGHGLESGVIAIMLQTAVRTLYASEAYNSLRFFRALNQVIFDNVKRMRCDRNLTLSLLHYHDNTLTISGQHEEIIVVRQNGAIERHDTLDLGFALGLIKDISHLVCEMHLTLLPGDVVVAYTDGITEAIDARGVPFGVDLLADAVSRSRELSSAQIRDHVRARLAEHTGSLDLLDDTSFLVVKPA